MNKKERSNDIEKQLKMMKRKQGGFNLIEVLIVLAILGGFVALIATRSNEATQSQATQQVVTEIPDIYRGVQRNFGNEGTEDLDNEIAANLGIKPSTVRGDSSTWRNEFEGEYNLEPLASDDYAFELEVTNVPTGEPCSTILTEIRQTGWTNIEVSSSSPSDTSVSEWGVAAIANACDIDSNDNIDITFVYDPS